MYSSPRLLPFPTIKQQDVCIQQHGAGEGQLHLPPSTQLRDVALTHGIVKANLR